MKNCGTFIAVQVVWLLVAAVGSPGQTAVDPAPTRTDSGGQVIVPSTTPTESPVVSLTDRPLRPERRALPPEVERRINRFRADARAYLERQEALRRQFQGASADERAKIRAQLESLRQEWIERARELRKDFLDRRDELMDKLPGYKKMLLDDSKTSVRDQLRNQAKEQQGEIRDRRGTD